jgi:hypothetical protein
MSQASKERLETLTVNQAIELIKNNKGNALQIFDQDIKYVPMSTNGNADVWYHKCYLEDVNKNKFRAQVKINNVIIGSNPKKYGSTLEEQNKAKYLTIAIRELPHDKVITGPYVKPKMDDFDNEKKQKMTELYEKSIKAMEEETAKFTEFIQLLDYEDQCLYERLKSAQVAGCYVASGRNVLFKSKIVQLDSKGKPINTVEFPPLCRIRIPFVKAGKISNAKKDAYTNRIGVYYDMKERSYFKPIIFDMEASVQNGKQVEAVIRTEKNKKVITLNLTDQNLKFYLTYKSLIKDGEISFEMANTTAKGGYSRGIVADKLIIRRNPITESEDPLADEKISEYSELTDIFGVSSDMIDFSKLNSIPIQEDAGDEVENEAENDIDPDVNFDIDQLTDVVASDSKVEELPLSKKIASNSDILADTSTDASADTSTDASSNASANASANAIKSRLLSNILKKT